MQAMKAIMYVQMREVDGITTKTIGIDGLTTFRQALERLNRKLNKSDADKYQLYGSNNELIEDLDQGVMAHAGYDKLKLNYLYKRDALKKAQSVGEALLNMAHYLKIYAEYCSNQMQSFDLLKTLKKERPAFDGFLKGVFKNSRTRKLDIHSFLVMPLQRVCKYPLLLRELLAQTPAQHPDYQPLQKASQLIGETVITINEKKREAEEQAVMINLQNELDGLKGFTVIGPARRFNGKGKVIFFEKKKSEEIPAEYFLFSDIILICTPKDESTGRRLFLDSMKIRNAKIKTEAESVSFEIGQLGKQRNIQLSCKSVKIKAKTIDTINKTILKDAFDDWLVVQKSQGKTVDITFFEWQNLYGQYYVDAA